MKRRNHPEVEEDDDQEEAEMDVDDEEKVEREEMEESDEDEEETAAKLPSPTRSADGPTPFLDTFYGLSSADPRERALAAQTMINHCLIGPDANTKDASYALSRLLNGLCSGRAAARQGNASALASFLKIAFQQGKIRDIQMDTKKGKDEEVSGLAFVRQHLLAATESCETGGRRKGSEDRDYKFGRLFGILGVVRSGVLLPVGENRPDLDDILEVATDYVKDLAAMYAYKKWMREPAAHAVGTLLNSFYAICANNAEAVKIVDHLVKHAVVPELLALGRDLSEGNGPLLTSFSAEQVALALTIQTHSSHHAGKLAKPIDQPVLSKETLPMVAAALSETSSVTQPRTHLVWDALCSFIAEPIKSEGSASVEIRRMRDKCPVGDESVYDLLEAVMNNVVMGKLLGNNDSGKTTHERSALALCLVRNMSGIEFMSSITGRTRLIIDPGVMENVVFNAALVKPLFLNILAAGSGGQKKQSTHLLRPLALEVLESLIESLGREQDHSESKRLAVATQLLRCDPRFDSKTKTNVVARLLRLAEDTACSEDLNLWDQYVDFLQRQVASAGISDSNPRSCVVSAYNAQGYVDLLFKFATTLLRMELVTSPEIPEYKKKTVRGILEFLMAAAFFDCSSVKDDHGTAKKSGKRKKKTRSKTQSSVVHAAMLIKCQREGAEYALPYNVRSVASARFFSLLADCVAAASHFSGRNKDSVVLDTLAYLNHSWKDLDDAGAVRFGSSEGMDTAENGTESPEAIVLQLQKQANTFDNGAEDPLSRAQKRCFMGLFILASTLHVHLLSCGRPEDFSQEEDPDADDDDDDEDIHDFIAEAQHVAKAYSSNNSDEDPLTVLAALCANILSSQIGSGNQSRGGSTKLLREVVKMAWIGGLSLSALSSDNPTLDPGALSILFGSIGAEGRQVIQGEEDSVEGSETDDSSDSDEASESEDEEVFAKAAKVPGFLEDENMSETSNDGGQKDGGEPSSDVELDPDRLQSLLEEDSDALSDGELEHHEGADKALAKLIEMKQEARKAGRMARERVLISHQLRCTLLLETLLMGKDDAWGALLRTDTVLQMILPILHYRKELENSLSKAAGKGSDHGIGEKRALLERLTFLLKSKILKMKHSGRAWTESLDVVDFSSTLVSRLLAEMRSRASKEHRSCTSTAMAAVIRAVPEAEDKIRVASVYEEAVSEWGSRKTTRLESSFFDDFINHAPIVAQATLVSPLAAAASTARSTYLRTESFRLLSLLYNSNLNSRTSDLEKMAFDRLAGAVDPVFEAFAHCFEDAEMKKSKRAREVLKSMEKVLTFLSSMPDLSHPVSDRISGSQEVLAQLRDSSDSQGVVSGCDRILKLVDCIVCGSHRDADAETDPTTEMGDVAAESKHRSSNVSSKKKRKKKPRKKKR